jgi:hypothetical protein
MSAAGDGLTEPNNNLRIAQMQIESCHPHHIECS